MNIKNLLFFILLILYSSCKNEKEESNILGKKSNIFSLKDFSNPEIEWDFTNYTVLKGYSVPIDHIPYNKINAGENVKAISIQDGALIEFSLAPFPNLDTLTLEGNKLKVIYSMENAKNLQFINFAKNRLETVPEISGLFTLKELVEPNLASNFLREIDSGAIALTKLKHLNLSNNRMLIIPKVIEVIRSLRVLDISFNNLIALPADPQKYAHLEKIILTGNPLSTEEISRFSSELKNTEIVSSQYQEE